MDNIKEVKINLPGKHNVLNAVAALAMANSYGISLPVIAKALLSFTGKLLSNLGEGNSNPELAIYYKDNNIHKKNLQIMFFPGTISKDPSDFVFCY